MPASRRIRAAKGPDSPGRARSSASASQAARGAVHQVHAERFRGARASSTVSSAVPAAVGPVGGGDAHEDRQVFPARRRGPPRRLRGRARAVVERAAVLVGPPVAQAARETGAADSRARSGPRPPGSRPRRARRAAAREGLDHGRDLALGELVRRRVAGRRGSRSAPTGGQPPSCRGRRRRRPTDGACSALRPAWASWMPAAAPCS